MFVKLVSLTTATFWLLCAGLTFAQMVEEKKGEGKKSVVVKIDPKDLPTDARLRLGKMSGYRYTGTFSFAIMSFDGKLLAVNGLGNDSITIVDLTTGTVLQDLPGRIGGGVMNMSFSPDGKSLAVTSFAQDLRVLDVATGKQQLFPHREQGGNRQFGPSFSADGKVIGVGTEAFGFNNVNNNSSTGVVKAWDVPANKPIATLDTIHNYNVRVAVAPDGKSMLSWGQFIQRGGGVMNNNNRDLPRTIQVWDLSTGKELRQIKIDFGPQGFGNVQNVAFTPDGKTLAVASGMATFHLVDFDTGKETRRFAGQRNTGGAMMRISPDGELLAVYDNTGMLQAWELKSGKRLELVDGPRSQLLSAGFPGNGRITVLGNQAQSLLWWDATAQTKEPPFQGHLTGLTALAFTPDGKSLLSAGNDQRLIWWNPQTGEEQRTLRLIDENELRYGGGYYPGNTMSFALSSDGRFAATLSNMGNGGIRLWNLKTGRVICDFEGPRSYSQIGIAFSPDNTRVAASGSQNPLHIWNIQTGQELPKLAGANPGNNPNEFGNSRIAFSPDGRVLAVHVNQYDRFTGQPMSDLILWDLQQSKELHRARIPLPNNTNGSGGMAFSPDSKLLAICEGSGSILLVNGTNGKEWRRLGANQRSTTFQLAFSADRRFLAAGSSPNYNTFNMFGKRVEPEGPTIEIWEIASGQLREQFKGHTGAITCLAFSPDGATLASGSHDATAILWDFTGKSGVKLPPITEEELPQAWKLFTSGDKQVPTLIRRMIATPIPTLAFMKKNFSPVKEAELSEQTIEKLVTNLGGVQYETRDKATRELQLLGERVEPHLRKAMAVHPSLEIRRRISDLLEKMERSNYTVEELQGLRGIEILERIGTEDARAWLTTLASGTSTARLTLEAKSALKRMKQ